MEQKAAENLQILWDYMHMGMAPQKADCIVGFGNLNLPVAARAAELYLQGFAPKLLFTGGLGRNTDDKWSGSEAARFARVAQEMGVPREDILLEDKSTNTAENILFTRRLLEDRGIDHGRLLGVHQQFMERRIYAAMKRHWPEVEFIVTSPETTVQAYLDFMASQGMREHSAIEVIVGDFQRMDLYAKRGWQIPQDIPERAWKAFEALVDMGYTGQLAKEKGGNEVQL